MMKCPNCGKINPNSYVCIYCGTSLSKFDSNDDVINITAEKSDDASSENINKNSNQQNKYQKQYEQQNYQQNKINQNNNYNSNQQNFQQSQDTKPMNKKNKAVTFVLSFFLPGIGYCYIDKWAEGLIIFLIEIFLFCIFWLIFPIFISFVIWLYSLIDSYNKTEQYNRGYSI